jgi:CubicO group peptidase (beta-lactamase class C family)
MYRSLMAGVAAVSVFAGATAAAQQASGYDYFEPQRQLIRNGVQAVLMCNGLFTSERPLGRVFEQELAYLRDPVGTAEGGNYRVDAAKGLVADEDVRSLPELTLPYPDIDPATTPWPNGDLTATTDLPAHVDRDRLRAASDWAFDRPTPEQDTLSLVVVHQGHIIEERYAEGVDMHTRTRTWSTAKSIAATLIGMLVDEGKLALDEPLDIDWLPELRNPEADPRNAITLRHVLNMSSGLYPVDSFGMEYATGSGLAYWAGASSVDGARRRGLVRQPGTFWDYENYDTLLAVFAMKQALGDERTYAEFPRRALLDRIGMRNTLVSTDRFGNFILSSQVYTNARDLARFGLLYLQDGTWEGERIVSGEWIDFVRTPAPATADRGRMYGGQFWLVPDDRDDVPRTAYSTSGNRGQYVIIVPSHDTVIVRRGLDYGRQGFNRWDLTREVLKAIPPTGAGD